MARLPRPLLIDSFLATILVFFVCWLLNQIVFNLEFLNPVERAMHYVEEEFSNLVYDNTRAPTGTTASTVCLVDIGKANRTEIARILNAIADQQPRLVAIDAVFDKKDMAVNPILQRALKRLQQQQKLVMASWVSIEGEKGAERVEVHESDVPYRIGPTGYTNFVAEEVNGMVRHHMPQLKIKTDKAAAPLSFAAQVVSVVNPGTWQDYGRHQAAMGLYEPDWILYQNDQNVFRQFVGSELTKGDASLAELTDKIVLVGAVNETDDPYVSEDLHLVPLEDIERMTGMQIHANIIAMLLDGMHLRKVADWIVWLGAFPLCWLLMMFLVKESHKEDIRSELRAKLVQYGAVIVITFSALLFFHFGHVELRTLPLLVPLALAADVLILYKNLICWLLSKRNYKPYFKNDCVHSE